MKKIIILAAALLICLAGFSQNKISIDSVANYIGQNVTVCSKVYGVKSLEKVSFINLGANYPNSPLTIVIFAKDRANFNQPVDSMYADKTVCVTGIIKEYKGKPEIIISKPADVSIQK